MRYVIIGNGAAGNAAAEAIRRSDSRGEVTLLSDEPHEAYYRPLLPFLIDNAPEGANLYRGALHTPQGVTVHLNTHVRAILPEERAVVLESGKHLPYDKLLLATGSSPLLPPIPGLRGDRVFVLRKLDDAQAIKLAAQGANFAVVIGGGRIGAKVALALRHLGLEINIVEMLSRLIPQQLDETASAIFVAALQAAGIKARLSQTVRQVVQGKRCSVVLHDGTWLPADLVVVATGISPNIDLAQSAGLAVRRSILVDKTLRTSWPDIYAAGDVVETEDRVTGQAVVSGTWTNAVTMGHVAGENMAGGQREYPGAFALLNAMELAGIPVISVGLVHPPAGNSYQVHTRRDGQAYRRLVFRDNTLVGFILVGEVEKAGVYTTLIREQADVGLLKRAMTTRTFSYAHLLAAAP